MNDNKTPGIVSLFITTIASTLAASIGSDIARETIQVGKKKLIDTINAVKARRPAPPYDPAAERAKNPRPRTRGWDKDE